MKAELLCSAHNGENMKTNFIRKPTPDEVYPQDKFVIEKVIELTEAEFARFISSPLSNYDFIADNIDLMYFDGNETYHCILVKANGYDYGILIESEGFSYARYTAYIHLGTLS